MSTNIEKEVNEFANQVYVFKTNVPMKFAEELRDWNNTCKQKAPNGFDDYRWSKMMYDHYFVKNYKPILETIIETIKDLNDKVDFLTKKLSAKNITDANKDLFK